MKKIHYVIYKITNKLNGMIYIGQHRTENINDDYMGSGVYLNEDIKRYGIQNFTKEIICECSSTEELNDKERELVNEEFVNRDDTYNLAVGGSYILTNFQAKKFGLAGALALQRRLATDEKFKKEFYEKAGRETKRRWKEQPEIYKNFRYDWTGRHHSEETKAIISEKGKLRVGEKNSMFGRMWVYNELVQANTTIDKKELHDYMEQGWEVGRVPDWNKHFMKKLKRDEISKRRLNRRVFKETGKNNPKVNNDLEQRIEYYKKLLPIFLHNQWKKFVELSGYKYSSQNFYYQMNVYLRLTRPQLKEMKKKTLQEFHSVV